MARKQVFDLSLNFLKLYIKLTSNSYFTCFHRVSDEISPGYPPMKIDDFEKLINFFSKEFELVDFKDSYQEKG